MGQTLSNVLIHATFSTHQRRPWLLSEVRNELFPYIGGILQNNKSQSLVVGGHDDHVHCLFVLGKTESVSDTISKVKSNSSRWLKGRFPNTQDFAWQAGYAASSIGRTEVGMVSQYIVGQEELHGHISFQDELRKLCTEYCVHLNEEYAWS